MCEREAGWHAPDIKDIVVEIIRDSPSCHHPPATFFRIPMSKVTAHIAVCSTVHTDCTLYAKLARRQTSESTEREHRKTWTWRHGRQTMGDSGMSQHCTEPDHNTETNTIWKPYSVTLVVLFLWTWDLPQVIVINTMMLEADVQLREETVAVSTQNVVTARAARIQYLIMTSCYIWIVGQQLAGMMKGVLNICIGLGSEHVRGSFFRCRLPGCGKRQW